MAIELKKNIGVNLKKQNNFSDEIIINLQWSQEPTKKGFFNKLFGKSAIDLDLGCLYELHNGEKSAIQALGNRFGSLNTSPYIALDKDDRTGESDDGETLSISGIHLYKIKRILVYSFIYDGVINWEDTDATVTFKQENNSELDFILKLNNFSKKRMCALALLEYNNDILRVEKIEEYFKDHIALDKEYKWGLRWVNGRK